MKKLIYNTNLVQFNQIIYITDYSYNNIKNYNLMYFCSSENIIEWKYISSPYTTIIFIQNIKDNIYFYFKFGYNKLLYKQFQINYIYITKFNQLDKINIIDFINCKNIELIVLPL